MKWDPQVEALLDRLVSKQPEGFRAMSRPIYSQGAESMAQERGSTVVEERDLLLTILAEVPHYVREKVLDGLEKEGIDLEKYKRLLPEGWDD